MVKKQLSKPVKIIIVYASLLVGSLMLSISNYMFLVPAKLIPGGITGISSMIETLFLFPAQYTIVILNIPLLITALFILDKRLVWRTIIGILLVSLFMELFTRLNLYKFSSSHQPLIPALISGLLSGMGIGLMLNADASSGGTEIVGLMLQKKNPSIKFSRILFLMNVFVMIVSSIMYLIFADMQTDEIIMLLVCSIIQSVISSKGVDFILNGLNSAIKFEIVTKNSKAICEAIKNSSEYGVTIIESKGAYSEENNVMLICVVHKSKMSAFKRLIKENDPNAFVFTTDTREILGNNFKSNR